MKAAIYARKSNDDSDRHAADKSVTRQVEHARGFIEAKGWQVAEDHIFVDDNVSGAEYADRPGLARLMAVVPKRGRPPFEALVMSESSRLGRDMTRNAFYIVSLLEAGIEIHYYLTGEQERADTPEQKIVLTLRSYASEVERQKAGQRARDALVRRAKQGFNAGGIIYGYDNIPIKSQGPNGEQTRTHTDFAVNKAQADVLRRIFRMRAAGHGPNTIAKAMNGDPKYAGLSQRYFEGQTPRPPRKGTGSWAASSIHAMLRNERYLGVLRFGEYANAYRHGAKVRVRRKESEVLRAVRPDLRIIPDALWGDVQAQIEAARTTYMRDTGGKVWGRPGNGQESRYLLTGFCECGVCAHNVTMVGGRGGSVGSRHPTFYYGCSYYANRGRTVCANGYRARMQDADALVLGKIKELVLQPAAMDYVIDQAMQRLADQRRDKAHLPKQLEAELRKERRQRENFLAMIGAGNAPASVMQRIAELDAGIARLELRLQELQTEEPSELELRRLRSTMHKKLNEFEALMHGDVPAARQALRKLLAGRIEFRPEEKNGARRYHLRWAMTVKPLFGDGYIELASPRGSVALLHREIERIPARAQAA